MDITRCTDKWVKQDILYCAVVISLSSLHILQRIRIYLNGCGLASYASCRNVALYGDIHQEVLTIMLNCGLSTRSNSI